MDSRQHSTTILAPIISRGNSSFCRAYRVPILIAIAALIGSIIIIVFATTLSSPYQRSPSSPYCTYNTSSFFLDQTKEDKNSPSTVVVRKSDDVPDRVDLLTLSNKQSQLMTSLGRLQQAFDALVTSINESATSSFVVAFQEFHGFLHDSISTSYIDDQWSLIKYAVIDLLRPDHNELIKLKQRVNNLPSPIANQASWERFNRRFHQLATSPAVQFIKPVAEMVQSPNPYDLWTVIGEICTTYQDKIAGTDSVVLPEECTFMVLQT